MTTYWPRKIKDIHDVEIVLKKRVEHDLHARKDEYDKDIHYVEIVMKHRVE